MPMLEFIGTDVPQETIRETFMMAVTVWNAVVFEQWGMGRHYVEEVRERIRSGNVPLMSALIDDMIERKRKQFAADLVSIGFHEVIFNPDGATFTVRAEARAMPVLTKS